jgi:hypothetical protein
MNKFLIYIGLSTSIVAVAADPKLIEINPLDEKILYGSLEKFSDFKNPKQTALNYYLEEFSVLGWETDNGLAWIHGSYVEDCKAYQATVEITDLNSDQSTWIQKWVPTENLNCKTKGSEVVPAINLKEFWKLKGKEISKKLREKNISIFSQLNFRSFPLKSQTGSIIEAETKKIHFSDPERLDEWHVIVRKDGIEKTIHGFQNDPPPDTRDLKVSGFFMSPNKDKVAVSVVSVIHVGENDVNVGARIYGADLKKGFKRPSPAKK